MEKAKPEAIIFDIDGTLAHGYARIERRGKKAAWYADWDAHDDEVDQHVSRMVNFLKEHYKIIICSGRKDGSKDVLKKWLEVNEIHYDELFMRKQSDNRQDAVVKEEIYHNDIEPNYNVWLVFDDRNQVVDMWRNKLNLKVFQVAEGNF